MPRVVLQAHFPQVWSELRSREQLCDGVVRCADGGDVRVHRAILSAASTYFKALFTNSLNGGQHEVREVTLAERADALRPILDYAYTGESGVTAQNVEQVLPLADKLGVVGAVQQCCQLLLREMVPDNCLGIFRFAHQYFCHDLATRGRRYILRHFCEILHQSNELYDLTADELRSLLADDELNARDEEVVFEAVRRWVDVDVPDRKQHLADLLPCVRLGLTSLQFLDIVLAYEPIRNDEQVLAPVKEFLSEAGARRDRGVNLRSPLARPRVPYEVVFAVGGWRADRPTNFIETYDCRADRWCQSPNADARPRAYHGLVVLSGLIYMIGGFDGVEHYNSVRSFNPVTREWREQACMYQARCYVSVCTLGGEIFALGGSDGRTRLNSVEAYDPQRNQWRLMPPMHKARSDGAAAALNGKVYVAGGFSGQELLSSAEVFDPETAQWSVIPNMLSARSGVSLLAHRGSLYALGGSDGHERLSSGERFDPSVGGWQAIPSMCHPRSNFAAVVLEDLIYVMGGFNGAIISNAEHLDVDKNEWSEVQHMNLNRSGLAAVVLAGPHCM
ncbi:hypothetical protein ONE63_006113 [Megalurothrips usitatus]|uniref:Kelch-like protein diablo n=1 Tax=Megalurothrips usitatus TaxID=439358 RepID=A0AAV7XSE1_9NEOP|nr:hypothetical protein ONE63_006113 [Megalurothrips usitatus]